MLKKLNFPTLLKILFFCSLLVLAGCMQSPPNHIENICSIFQEYPGWYWSAQDVQTKWGLPINVLMAVVYQESRFRADAKPPREKLLWIIPWRRPTSAYGYSQAINHTWRTYKRQTGNSGASRDAFTDAADFIGWYAHRAHLLAGISRANAYQVYLAYHEGIGGYKRRTYQQKGWLMPVAKKVQRRAWIYRQQLIACENSLPKKSWWRFW